MADIAKFIEEIKGMTVVELNELVKALEEEFGVSAAAPVAVAAAPAAGAAAEAAEEKTEFNVKLKDIGAKKIEVIKAVREFTSLGLAEAKALVEGLGMIKEGVNKEEAEKIAARMKEAGAEVTKYTPAKTSAAAATFTHEKLSCPSNIATIDATKGCI